MVREEKIKPEDWYTLQDIVRMKLFPWTSFSYVRKAVLKDRKGKNVLQALISGKGTGKKYNFKGINIIKFVKSI